MLGSQLKWISILSALFAWVCAHAEPAVVATTSEAQSFVPQTTLEAVSGVQRGTIKTQARNGGFLAPSQPEPPPAKTPPKAPPKVQPAPVETKPKPPPRTNPAPPPPPPSSGGSDEGRGEGGLAVCRPDCPTCCDRAKRKDPITELVEGGRRLLGLPTGKGSCKLLAAAKRLWTGRGIHGQCGAGVGASILKAGYPFATAGRDAILYQTKFMKQYGWNKAMDIPPNCNNACSERVAAQAPPGTVLVFSGPCSARYGYPPPYPIRQFGCNRSAGYRVGHVTIKGDKPGQYFTDGQTRLASPNRDRYLVGVWSPPDADDENCGGR